MNSSKRSGPDHRFGFHVSIAGGIEKAPDRAYGLGCDCFQVFTSPPQNWRPPLVTTGQATTFTERCRDIRISDYYCHSIYLINLATSDARVRRLSIESLQRCYEIAVLIRAKAVITHIGSSLGSNRHESVMRVAKALDKVNLDPAGETLILLENSAGAGNHLGATFVEIASITAACQNRKKIGLCLDTAHAFAAGYDITHKGDLDRMLSEIDSNIGLDRLYAVHANDSRYPLGSRHDRHENIGQGYIGLDGFRTIVNHPFLKNKPFILETPGFRTGYETQDLATIRSLVTV